MTRRSLTCLSILLFALSAAAQTSAPIEIEAGYRWSSVNGNEDLYRTQIDERSGFVVRAFTFFTPASSGFTDRVRIDATDLGVGPARSLRIEAGKADLYKLRLGYRSFDTFSALPSFANPLFAQGITPGQHTIDGGDLEGTVLATDPATETASTQAISIEGAFFQCFQRVKIGRLHQANINFFGQCCNPSSASRITCRPRHNTISCHC